MMVKRNVEMEMEAIESMGSKLMNLRHTATPHITDQTVNLFVNKYNNTISKHETLKKSEVENQQSKLLETSPVTTTITEKKGKQRWPHLHVEMN